MIESWAETGRREARARAVIPRKGRLLVFNIGENVDTKEGVRKWF